VPLLCLRLSLSANFVIGQTYHSFMNIYADTDPCHFMSLCDNFVFGQIMSFLSFNSFHFKSFHVISFLFMSFLFVLFHVILFHVISSHFMRYHVISCVIIGLFHQACNKVGRGQGGQICLPRPWATASLSGRRQK
jgi:hypothetical protein